MIGLLEVSLMAGTLLAGLAWLVVVLLSRRGGAGVTASPRSHGFLARAWLFAPIWFPVLLLSASFLPGLLGPLGMGYDHCLVPHAHHHHLCLLHPPHASEHVLSWALPLALVLPAIPLLATCVRRARRELGLARALVSVSRPSSFGSDVRLLDREEALALTVGLGRPTVLISTGLVERVSKSTLDVVLAHERAHVARQDTGLALVERLMASLFPARVGAALLSRITLAREQACDSMAARVAGGPLAVARALADVARADVRVPATGVSIASGALEARIEQLLEPARGDRRWVLAVIALGLGLAAAGAGPVHSAVERFITFLIH